MFEKNCRKETGYINVIKLRFAYSQPRPSGVLRNNACLLLPLLLTDNGHHLYGHKGSLCPEIVNIGIGTNGRFGIRFYPVLSSVVLHCPVPSCLLLC